MDNKQETPDAGLHFLDYWRVIRSRKEIVLAVTLLVVLTGTAFTFMLPKKFESEARILVHKDVNEMEVFERQLTPGYDPFFLRTQYEIIQSRPILYQVIRDLNLQEEWGKVLNEDNSPISQKFAYGMLKGSIDVSQSRDTSLIAIRVRREDHEEAARIANQVAEVYKEQRLAVKNREMKRGLDALENELKKQQAKVNVQEEKVENLRQELDVVLVGAGRRIDEQKLMALEGDLINAKVDMLVRKTRYESLAGLAGKELLDAAMYLVADPSVSALQRALDDKEVSLQLLLENLGDNHPDVKQMKTAVDQLAGKLEDRLRGMLKGLEADFEVAKTKHDAMDVELKAARTSDIMAHSEKFLPFYKAQEELTILREILNAVRAKLAQEGITYSSPRNPVELIDPAEPNARPVSPDLMLNIIISLVVGLGTGICLAYFIEYLDTSVKTVDDVERFLGLSVLGVIPQKVRPLIEEGPDSPHAESYRVLRTNMLFGTKGLSGGAFAVASGGVGEGKSTTLFNLAYICAQQGDKVLVVDSDLRRPVQHSILGVSNRFGLTNVLIRDVPIEEAIKPTSVTNLHFLPSGKLPSSSLGILDSQRMRELVKNLKARYDYVFFDSPPIVGVSDASILCSEVDGVLLVVQYRKYPRTMSTRAKRMIENVGGNIIGVVLNNINIMRDDYYYYYHSSYTHYLQSTDSAPEAETAVTAGEKNQETL